MTTAIYEKTSDLEDLVSIGDYPEIREASERIREIETRLRNLDRDRERLNEGFDGKELETLRTMIAAGRGTPNDHSRFKELTAQAELLRKNEGNQIADRRESEAAQDAHLNIKKGIERHVALALADRVYRRRLSRAIALADELQKEVNGIREDCHFAQRELPDTGGVFQTLFTKGFDLRNWIESWSNLCEEQKAGKILR